MLMENRFLVDLLPRRWDILHSGCKVWVLTLEKDSRVGIWFSDLLDMEFEHNNPHISAFISSANWDW